ncbi:MAG: GGDEF domain-containing protein [Burkholderiales bacterium PBB3]|nr:MAG: GGDEF domain-containing protein [Burkholderiales bacterium PBB3]
MRIPSLLITPAKPAPAKSLAKLLGDSKRVKDLVVECAEELSSVNTALKQEDATQDATITIVNAIERSEAVEGKVQEAAEKLSEVNQALAVEVHARHALEQQLDTVTQESESALHAAFHDALTGLPNRALFDNRLEHGLAQAKRHGFTLAVMFIDLDGFKAINDKHGHAIGDAVLQSVADRLQENTREDDTVSRYGGDEFLYLLMSIDDDKHVLQIAEKIAEAIQKPCALSVGDVVVKSSIGISIFPKDGSTAADLITSADKAMYQAKRAKVDYVFA